MTEDKFPPPRQFQIEAHDSLKLGFRDGHKNQIIMSPTGSGKCLGKDTPVLMADGTTKLVQHVVVGDKLLGPDGGIRNVMSIASGQENLYRITPRKGDAYVVNASHILSLRKTPGSDGIILADGTKLERDADIVNVNVETLFNSNATAKHCLKGWRSSAVEFHAEPSDLLLEPYLLGFLGFRFPKPVPREYKTASVAQRLMLIAGMIDCDGSVSKNGFDWVCQYKWLAEDFAFLCRSVGLAAYIKPCKKQIKSRGFVGDYWRVSVSGETDIIPCIVKRASPRTQKKFALVHGINIEPIGYGDYFGFEIDGDHLFLLGDFTVTHNTFLGLKICNEAIKKGKRAVFLCDRTTLIDQTSAVADRYGMHAHGIIQANHWRRKPNELFQIASVQTIGRRGYWPKMDVLVVDEAHTTYSAWTEFAQNTNAAVIGLSATPFTKGLGKIFSNLINATTMHDLTQNGVLVPMRIFSCQKPDMTGAATAGGEWTDKAAEERELKIVGDVVSDWLRLGENRKTIIFGTTIKHCEELARQFIGAGVMCAVFTADTKPKEREDILKEYRKPDSHLKILISVEALAKGFDVPDVSCICDARPLRKSLSTAIQMWGRGLRSCVGKKDCILLDFSGNIIRFFEDFNDIYFNGLDKLDDGEKLDKEIRKKEEFEPRGCPQCGYKPFLKRCMSCGYEKVSAQISEALPGHMKEIFIGDGSSRKKLADNAEHLWNQVVSYARFHSKPEKQNGRAFHLFKNITGQEPKWKFSTAPNVEITKNVFNKITQLNMKWKKGYGK